MKKTLILLLFPLLIIGQQAPITGCTDPSALNYNAEATEDDDSCIYCTSLDFLGNDNFLEVNDIHFEDATGVTISFWAYDDDWSLPDNSESSFGYFVDFGSDDNYRYVIRWRDGVKGLQAYFEGNGFQSNQGEDCDGIGNDNCYTYGQTSATYIIPPFDFVNNPDIYNWWEDDGCAWKNITAVFCSNSVRLYVDGQIVQQSVTNLYYPIPIFSLDPLDLKVIGADQFGEQPCDVQIDEFRIWSRALSDLEIQERLGDNIDINLDLLAEQNNEIGQSEGYWKFDSLSLINEVNDLIGVPNNLPIQFTNQYCGYECDNKDYSVACSDNSNNDCDSCTPSEGCTDPEANNYDSTADIDNGICVYYGCMDDGNQIWSYTPGLEACNYDSDANYDDGSCIYGSEGFDCNGDCISGSEVTLTAVDSYGNGWNGNIMNIVIDGELLDPFGVGFTYTLLATYQGGPGDYEEISVCLPDGVLIETSCVQITVDGGSYQSEVSWEITIDGIVITSGGAPFEGELGCPVSGCMDESACNYDEEAIEDDGTCIYPEEGYDCEGNALDSTQDIDLVSGWNLWSTYISPEDSDMVSVFADIVDNLTIVKDQYGNVYWPLFGLNSIADLTWGQGYQAKMNTDNILSLTGSLIPSDYSISLNSGWGIMGYLHLSCYNAIDMMAPIIDDLTILKDESGQVYWPMFGLNSIGDMCPGEGYQIKTIGVVDFSYPSGGRFGFSNFTTVGKTIHYNSALNTGNNMTVGLPTTSWNVMPAIGDEIAAYDESDRLIGNTVFTGNNIALTVWGDDLTTDSKDGLLVGEKVILKLWNSDMNTEETLMVTKWDSGSDSYTINGISIASNIKLSKILVKDLIKITDVLGREHFMDSEKSVLLYIYNDGSVEKKYILK